MKKLILSLGMALSLMACNKNDGIAIQDITGEWERVSVSCAIMANTDQELIKQDIENSATGIEYLSFNEKGEGVSYIPSPEQITGFYQLREGTIYKALTEKGEYKPIGSQIDNQIFSLIEDNTELYREKYPTAGINAVLIYENYRKRK